MNARITAMWWATIGVALGATAVLVAFWGDMRVGVGWGIAVVAVGVVVATLGGSVTPYRPVLGAALMLAGVLGVIVGEWTELSRWVGDVWTSATGARVTYEWRGVTYAPDVWGVLSGSVSLLASAGAIVFTAVAAVIAYFGTEPEHVAGGRPTTRPASL